MPDGQELPESGQDTPSIQRQCLSPKEYVAVTGLSLSTVHRLLEKKQLPKDQPGGKGTRILIPIHALAVATPKAQESPIGHKTGHSVTVPTGEQGRLSGRQPLWMTGQRGNKT